MGSAWGGVRVTGSSTSFSVLPLTLLGLDDLIGLHINLEFMAFPRLVHNLDLTEAFALLVFAFDAFDPARLGRDRRPDARDGLVRRERRG